MTIPSPECLVDSMHRAQDGFCKFLRVGRPMVTAGAADILLVASSCTLAAHPAVAAGLFQGRGNDDV
jgi:hypothetical protein